MQAFRRLVRRYVAHDLKRNIPLTLTLLVLLTMSAVLMASGALLVERVAGSVDRLASIAQPPHFLHMHQGEYDEDAVASFAESRPEVEDWQISRMVGFEGDAVQWEGASRGDFSSSHIDLLFLPQNDGFDLLVDSVDHEVVFPSGSDIFVPVALQAAHQLATGDTLRVLAGDVTHTLTIAGFVKDAQMASSLSAATRFVVSPEAFEALLASGHGTPEIIVEFRVSDTGLIGDLQRAYENHPGLPVNGQAVTDTMIRIVNMVSDGLVAVGLIFASLTLIVLAIINLRFVIRSSLEEEVREIATMRAIGLPARDIGRLYLARYRLLTLIACLLGGILSIIVIDRLTQSMHTHFVLAPVTWVTVAVAVVALALVAIIVLGMSASSLRVVKRLDIVPALLHGTTEPEPKPSRRRSRSARPTRVSASQLAGVSARSLPLRLSRIDVWAERRDWLLVPIVFFLSAVLMLVPYQLLTTFESPKFMTYFGAPMSDVRADIQFLEGSAELSATEAAHVLTEQLDADPAVASYTMFATQRVQVLDNGHSESTGPQSWSNLNLDMGDVSPVDLEMVSRSQPAPGEIALSALNAEKLGAQVGDSLTIRDGSGERTHVISGIYQDITNGGFTAKLAGPLPTEAERWTLFITLHSPASAPEVATQYDADHPYANVIPVQEYVQETLSYATDGLRTASIASVVLGLGASALVTSLFVRLRLSKDQLAIGTQKAMGFSSREITLMYLAKLTGTAWVGTVLAVLAVWLLIEPIAGGLFASLGVGITQLSMITQPVIVYVLFPITLLGVAALVTWVTTRPMRHTPLSEFFR